MREASPLLGLGWDSSSVQQQQYNSTTPPAAGPGKRESTDVRRPDTVVASPRIVALDLMRGLTVAFMIIVDNPGDPQSVWPQLDHAPWDGWTITDLVFPFFLFIMGVSIAIVADRDRARSVRKSLAWIRILRRTILLFAIGVGINVLSHWLGNVSHNPFNATLRVLGVLQRLALCYILICAVAELPLLFQSIVMACVLLVYCMLMYVFDVPGCGRAQLTEFCNTESYFDYKMFPTLMSYLGWSVDPEGLLTTLTACMPTWAGYLTGRSLSLKREPQERVNEWTMIGQTLVALGYLLSVGVPFNKRLFSPSFVLLTVGMALIVQAFLMYIVDIRKWTRLWTFPFISMGMNPLIMFVGMDVLAVLLLRLGPSGTSGSSFWNIFYSNVFATWLPSSFGSFLCAVVYCILWLLLAMLMHRKKVYIRL